MSKKIDDEAKKEMASPELNDGEVKEKKSGKKIANTIINVILVIAIIIAAFCTYISFVSSSGNGVPSIFGLEMFSIKTESMYPTLASGDLIFDTRVKDMRDLKVSDVITYWTVIDGERVLNTHRIFQIYDGGNYLIFQTKGDNNPTEDALTVHESEVVGKWTGKKLGGAGKVFEFLQTSTGFLIVVVIPVAIFFIFHLVQFFRVLFEYQNVKNRLVYEQERGKSEDELEESEREKIEAEIREKLKAEFKESGGAEPEEKKAKTEEEIRAELEAKIRAEFEAKAKAEAEAGKAEAETPENKDDAGSDDQNA